MMMAANGDVPNYHGGASSARGRGETFFSVDDGKKNVLVVTRGHAFQRDAFFDIFEANLEIQWSAVEHPAAQLLFNPEQARHFDCYVLYDMPGIKFNRHGDGVPNYHQPPEFYRQGLLAMLDEGVPMVILHHAAAAWPAWPEWAEIVGGRFLYQPMELRGESTPDSGYVLDVEHKVRPVAEHPITHQIEAFDLVDELYLWEVFEDSVVPLFRSDFCFSQEHFYSAKQALAGNLNSREGWSHEPASNLVGWVKHYANSPIVYLQFGDGPQTYANEMYRRILANAIRWACSPDARQWARQRAQNAVR